MKVNWKKKFEETNALLKAARDASAILLDECRQWKEELQKRPIIEKIVEKEVLPWWVTGLISFLLGSWIVVHIWVFTAAKKLQTPILSPYPVYVANYIAAAEINTQLSLCQAHDKAATDAWRADEKTIRKLQREKP